jgi:hypothetical protein
MRHCSTSSFLWSRILIIFAAGVFLIPQTLVSRGEIRQERLFVITRNKNDNMVCYDACISESKLDQKEPVRVYWVIPKENNKIEDLSLLERKKAYGFEIVKEYGTDSADIKLKPLPRTMRVKRHDGKWVAITTIDSVQAILTSAHVMAESTGIIPKVNWVRLKGVDVFRGSEVVEVIKP